MSEDCFCGSSSPAVDGVAEVPSSPTSHPQPRECSWLTMPGAPAQHCSQSSPLLSLPAMPNNPHVLSSSWGLCPPLRCSAVAAAPAARCSGRCGGGVRVRAERRGRRGGAAGRTVASGQAACEQEEEGGGGRSQGPGAGDAEAVLPGVPARERVTCVVSPVAGRGDCWHAGSRGRLVYYSWGLHAPACSRLNALILAPC